MAFFRQKIVQSPDDFHLAVSDDADAVAEAFDVGENVAGEEDRFADFLAFLDEFGDVASTERIESRLWLVEYDEFGVADEGLSEPDALEHAF